MVIPPGNGDVRPEDYATPEYLELLSPVVSRAQEDLPGYPLDEQELGRSIALLLQFMEQELGRDSASSGKRVPKLPVKPLRDFSGDGPLLSLVGVFEAFQRDRDWEADDFSSQDAYPKSQCLELIQEVRSVWEAKGFVAPPQVFVDPSCGDDLERLQGIVSALGGAVAASADEQGVTHHVFPQDKGAAAAPPEAAEHAPQTLQVLGGLAYVHWQQLPDSYDRWVDAQEAPEPATEPPREAVGAWRVSAQYLAHSELYNEWMNPSDYALPEPRGTKRGREEEEEEPAAEEVPEVTPGAGVEVAEGVVKQVVGNPHLYAMDGLARALRLGGGHLAEAPAASRTLPAEAEVHRVPAHASWFRWNQINDIERRANPEFFNGRSTRKTPRAYKEMRDCIINLFRHDPSRRLTFTECRSKIAADATSVLRLWGFLDHWGIINFLTEGAAAGSASSSEQQQQQQQNHPRVEPGGLPAGARILNAPPATQNLYAMNQVDPTQAAKAAASGSAGPAVAPPAVAGQLQQSRLPGAAEFLCNADPSHLCGAVRYHCTTTPDVDICSACFAGGRIPVGMTQQDFIKINTQAAESGGEAWSEQETLLLLEALEVHGENWADIAEHVGTRSQVQCITHFLQLPIEDQFIDPLEARRHHHTVGAPGQDPPAPSVPALFAGAGNPIMTQAALLATIAGPRVAAAAAKAALETLAEAEADVPDGEVAPAADGAEKPPAAEAAAEGAEKPPAAEAVGEPQKRASAPPTEVAVQAAAATGLAAAAVKAKLLADQEERELQRLVVGVIQNQAEKLELKARLFDDLEAAMERERLKLEEGWRTLLAERLQFQAEKAGVSGPQALADAEAAPSEGSKQQAAAASSAAAVEPAAPTPPAAQPQPSDAAQIGATAAELITPSAQQPSQQPQ